MSLLQLIAAALEDSGIPVSAIEIWPPNDDGGVSVSLTVRLPPEPQAPADGPAAREG